VRRSVSVQFSRDERDAVRWRALLWSAEPPTTPTYRASMPRPLRELRQAGVAILGTSIPTERAWRVDQARVQSAYVPDASKASVSVPTGPVCIAGTPYSVFTREGDRQEAVDIPAGGGACCRGFYNATSWVTAQAPPQQGPFPGRLDPTLRRIRLPTTRSCTCRIATAPPSAATTT